VHKKNWVAGEIVNLSIFSTKSEKGEGRKKERKKGG
jgi:hypothetical protein